jgi:hypothetical protein
MTSWDKQTLNQTLKTKKILETHSTLINLFWCLTTTYLTTTTKEFFSFKKKPTQYLIFSIGCKNKFNNYFSIGNYWSN